MVKTKIKNCERVLSFLLCLVILFTVTIHAPVHKPKAFVITGTSAVIIAMIVACGIDLAINNFDELQSISNDFWDWMTDKTDYPGLEDTVNVMANNMTNIYDPITGSYVNSNFKVGTQEYIDMHKAVNDWAADRIIDGEIKYDNSIIEIHNKSVFYHNQNYTTGIKIDDKIYKRDTYPLENGTKYSVNWYLNEGFNGKIDFTASIEPLDMNYNLYKVEYKIFDKNEEIIYERKEELEHWVNYSMHSYKLNISNNGFAIINLVQAISGTNGKSWVINLGYEQGITNTAIPNEITITKNPDAPPIFIPTNKYEWPFEIKQRWHNDNVNNPEGTGEKEFTVNLEKPLENLKPENVLPKDLTDGLTFPSVANPGIEGTLGRILEGIQSFIDGIQTKITDGILDAVDWLDGMPDIPRFAVQITLIPILLIVFLLSILLLLLRIGLFVGYLINAPVSTIGINADVLLGINKILQFDLGHTSNNLNGVKVIDVITIVIYILFALSVFSIAKRFEVYRSGALWSKDDSDKWTDKNDPSKIIPAKPKTARF